MGKQRRLFRLADEMLTPCVLVSGFKSSSGSRFELIVNADSGGGQGVLQVPPYGHLGDM